MDMETLEFWLYVALCAGALALVWFMVFVGWASQMLDAKVRQRHREIEQQLQQQRLIPLTVETAGDQYLCYNAKDMAFVCQGQNLEQIQQRFRQRYPDRGATIINGDQPAVTLLREQLKDQRENSSGIRSTS